MKEKRVDNEGNFIPRRLQMKEIAADEPGILPIPNKHRKAMPQNPDNKAHYDIIIRCATTALVQEYPPKVADMVEVCASCPFSKTACNEGVLLPTESQMQDIINILSMDEGEGDIDDTPEKDDMPVP